MYQKSFNRKQAIKKLILSRYFVIVLIFLMSSCLLDEEIEPNNDITTATPASLAVLTPLMRGALFPVSDTVDFYSIEANQGDRLYLATMSKFSSGNSDIELTVYRQDGVTVLETDSYSESTSSLGASISGLELPATETYYIKANGTDVRPYYLYADLVTADTVIPSEAEPNNTYLTAQQLPFESIIKGEVSVGDTDIFKIDLQEGDRVFLSLDLEPEADNTAFDGKLSFSLDGANLIESNNTGTGAPDSEALFVTVMETGTYHVTVSDSATTGGVGYNYILNADVVNTGQVSDCQSFSSSTPVTIQDNALTESQIEIADIERVGKVIIALDIDHSRLSDLDLVLQSPDGAESVLFTDLPGNSTNNLMVALADHEGAFPIDHFLSTPNKYIMQPESHSRLNSFDGANATGDWKLKIFDDQQNETGTLNSWTIFICPNATVTKDIECEEGYAKSLLIADDFEDSDQELETSGTNNQWQHGTPSLQASAQNASLDNCNSGSACWKTNLTGLYNSNSEQILKKSFSLEGVSEPIVLAWSQRFQLDAADKSSYSVKLEETENSSNSFTVFQHQQAKMEEQVGSATNIQESIGWNEQIKDISGFIGKNLELTFNLTTNSAQSYPGVAIDDIEVLGCFVDSDQDGIADRDQNCSGDSQSINCKFLRELREQLISIKNLAKNLVLKNNKFNRRARRIRSQLSTKRKELLSFIEIRGNNIKLKKKRANLSKLIKNISIAIKNQRDGLPTYAEDKKVTLSEINKLLAII
jgi:subtilisin-like proprotein convertase family protein